MSTHSEPDRPAAKPSSPGFALFTGGGTGGHVTPNFGVIEELADRGWRIEYAGSRNGIERTLVERRSIPYHSVSTGKLRRYLTIENLKDQFRVLKGLWDGALLIRRLKPDVVFSKGGFVTFPIVVGAWLNRVPAVIHESDSSPGLATRLCAPFAKKICITFEKTRAMFKKRGKVVYTGTPIRRELLQGSAEQGRTLLGFPEARPIVLVFGGSLGATALNARVREALPHLTSRYSVVHVCGAGKLDAALEGTSGYRQFEYVHEEFAHMIAAADMVVARAGANSVYELLALRKANLLVPLSRRASRGDQIENAELFREQGWSLVIQEDDLSVDRLVSGLAELETAAADQRARMSAFAVLDSAKLLADIIEDTAWGKTTNRMEGVRLEARPRGGALVE